MPKTFSLHGVFEFLFCKCCFAVAWTHSWTRMNIETSKLNSLTLLNVSIYGKEKHLLHPSDNDDDCNWNTPLSFYILQLTSLISIFIYLHLLIWNCVLLYAIMNQALRDCYCKIFQIKNLNFSHFWMVYRFNC